MKAGETLIGGAEVQRRVRRNRMFRYILRGFGAAALIAILIKHCVLDTSFRTVGAVVPFIACVLAFFGLITNTESARTCAQCGARLTEKEVLAMDREDFVCPYCGKPFQAAIDPGDFDF